MSTSSITLYTTTWCGWCDRAKSLLRSHGADTWTEIDVEGLPGGRTELIELTGGRTVPQIVIGDTVVGGYDEGMIAAACFFGGYALQFVGHAVEKSMPVLVKHPIQANLAAPFFTIVEIFKITGLRSELFNAVQEEIAVRRQASATE